MVQPTGVVMPCVKLPLAGVTFIGVGFWAMVKVPEETAEASTLALLL